MRNLSWCPRDVAVVLLLLAVAALPRIAILNAGLPDYPHTDETFTDAASTAVAFGHLNPKFFDWPGTLLFYIDGSGYRIFAIFGGSIRDAGARLWLARCVTLMFGLATVAISFLALRRLSYWGAILAALVIACSPLDVEQSALAMTDVPATFFLVASLWVTSRAVETDRSRLFFWAGVVGGLGCAIKYYVGIVGVGLLLAGWLASPDGLKAENPRPRSRWFRRVFLSATGGLVGFAVGCPPAIFAFRDVWNALKLQIEHQSSGHLGFESSYLHYLVPAIGWPILITAVLGVVFSIRRDWPLLRVTAATAIAYLVVMASSRVSFDRYAVPQVAMCGLLSAATIARFRPRWELASSASLVLVAVLAWNSFKLVHERRLPDTRDAATAWMRGNLDSKSRIIRTAGGPVATSVAVIYPFREIPVEAWAGFHAADVDFIILDSSTLARFDAPDADDPRHAKFVSDHRRFYRAVRNSWRLVHEEASVPGTNRGPTVWIYARPGS